MKILLPTDFSNSSKKAIKYATFLADTLKAELIIFHALSDLSIWLEKEEINTLQDAQSKLNQLAKSIEKSSNGRIKVNTFVVQRFPLNDVINDIGTKMKIDFVVMGTKGVTGGTNKLVGSFASGMIRHCNMPVLVVPDVTKCKTITKIVLPTDLNDMADEIKEVARFAKWFGAAIHVLFVPEKEGGVSLPVNAASITPYKNITFHEISGKNTEVIIEKFVADQNADLLAMFTRRRKFFARLFNPGLTESLSSDITIPLLVFKKDE